MSRKKYFQKLEHGTAYHIYNRGNNKENLFKNSNDYNYFLHLWVKYIEPIADTYCYCLLPNHFHFFVRIRSIDEKEYKPAKQTRYIEQHFSNLFNAYAKTINLVYNRTGSLFQERFRRKMISDEQYFLKMVGYILTNPCKHRIRKSASDYPHSSYFCTFSKGPSFVRRDEVISWFGGVRKLKEYLADYSHQLEVENWMLEPE